MAESSAESHHAKIIATVATMLVALLTASSAPWWWPRRADAPPAAVTPKAHATATTTTERASTPAATAPEAGELLYTARLGASDHCNSRGEPLNSASLIVRQDRANQEAPGAIDTDDERDSRFASKQARQELVRNVRIAPRDKRVIAERMPQIAVYAKTDGYLVRVLDPGDELVACR